MKNWGLKLTALALAALLSYVVNREENTTVFTFTAPIDLRVPSDRIVMGGADLHTQVTVRGPSFVIARIPAAPPTFRVTVPDSVGATHTLSLRGGDLPVPPYVRIVSIQPSELMVRLDRLVERTISINVPLIGAPEENHRVSGVVVRPETVGIRGPASFIEALTELQTEPVDISDARKGFTRTVPLRPPGSGVVTAVTEVDVEVKVAPLEIERTFAALPVEVRSVAGETYAITPPSVTLDVRGRKDLVNGLERSKIIPFVRLGAEPRARESVNVAVDLPAGLTAIRVDPPTVEIIRSVARGSSRGTGGSPRSAPADSRALGR